MTMPATPLAMARSRDIGIRLSYLLSHERLRSECGGLGNQTKKFCKANRVSAVLRIFGARFVRRKQARCFFRDRLGGEKLPRSGSIGASGRCVSLFRQLRNISACCMLRLSELGHRGNIRSQGMHRRTTSINMFTWTLS